MMHTVGYDTPGCTDTAVDSWSEFKDLVGRIVSKEEWNIEPELLCFRGHASSSWPLRASFDRVLSSFEPALRKQLHDKMLAFLRERLQLNSENQVPPEFNAESASDEQLAAWAQHHGTPTRLLDWSESPYVAAFFAFSDLSQLLLEDNAAEEYEEECAVFTLNRVAGPWIAESGVTLYSPDRRYNRRLQRQRSLFTLNTSLFDTLEEYVANYYNRHPSVTSDPTLLRIRIPRKEAPDALRELELMGISSETMFPSLDGSARYAFVSAYDRLIWRSRPRR